MPETLSGSAGLVLCIHGGGRAEGCKDQYTPRLTEVCDKTGVAAACMNCRYVSDEVHYGDLLDDIDSVLADIKKTGRQYGVDFDRVLLTGISAGGHLSLRTELQ